MGVMTVYKQSNGKNWWYKFTWNGKTVRGLRILIVDDFEVNRQVLHEQVFSWGMRDGSYSTAEEALDAIRAAQAMGDPFDLVIADYQIPEMDGATLGLMRT